MARIAFYLPNLLGYCRILLAFLGLYAASSFPAHAVALWVVASALDLVDGPVARLLHQTSELGTFLDIAADNILRTCVWIASVAASGDSLVRLLACMVICLEWLTMVSTQVHASKLSGSHWKKNRGNDHWIVQEMFRNNFRNPLGVLCIYGLFAANLFIYASNFDEIRMNFPLFHVAKSLAILGRVSAAGFEVTLCYQYFAFVIEQDVQSKSRHED